MHACAAILECCSRLLTERARLQEGAGSAAAVRSPGKRQLAPLEQLTEGLRLAANAWKKINRDANARPIIHDGRLSDIRRFDDLEAMAQDPERRLAGLFKLKAEKVTDPWPHFVRAVAACFRQEGMEPTATGRTYEDGSETATWFQKFMASLGTDLLGRDGERSNSPEAFYAAVAKAMGGDAKLGNAQR